MKEVECYEEFPCVHIYNFKTDLFFFSIPLFNHYPPPPPNYFEANLGHLIILI